MEFTDDFKVLHKGVNINIFLFRYIVRHANEGDNGIGSQVSTKLLSLQFTKSNVASQIP